MCLLQLQRFAHHRPRDIITSFHTIPTDRHQLSSGDSTPKAHHRSSCFPLNRSISQSHQNRLGRGPETPRPATIPSSTPGSRPVVYNSMQQSVRIVLSHERPPNALPHLGFCRCSFCAPISTNQAAPDQEALELEDPPISKIPPSLAPPAPPEGLHQASIPHRCHPRRRPL